MLSAPRVRISASPPPLFCSRSLIFFIRQTFLEKYSRGRRGAPAKGVGRATGARVQISPSPPLHKYTFGQASVFTEQLRILFEKSSNVLFLFLQKIFDKTVFNSYFLRYIFAASVFFVNGYAFNKSEHSFTVKLRYIFISTNHNLCGLCAD